MTDIVTNPKALRDEPKKLIKGKAYNYVEGMLPHIQKGTLRLILNAVLLTKTDNLIVTLYTKDENDDGVYKVKIENTMPDGFEILIETDWMTTTYTVFEWVFGE